MLGCCWVFNCFRAKAVTGKKSVHWWSSGVVLVQLSAHYVFAVENAERISIQFDIACLRETHSKEINQNGNWTVFKKWIWVRYTKCCVNYLQCVYSYDYSNDLKTISICRQPSSGMLRRILSYELTDISEVTTAFISHHPDNGDNKHLWNVGQVLWDNTAQYGCLHTRRRL